MFKKLKIWKKCMGMETDPIYEAVSNGDHKQLKTLLNTANENVINNKNCDESALDLAASLGDEISVELLLAHGAIPDYNRSNHTWSYTTLSRAISSGNHKVIRLLINHGCDPDTLLKVSNWKEVLVNALPYNYWFKCIEMNNLAIFKLLLECTGRKVGDNKKNQKMLLTACSLGSLLIVGYLLDHGVSVESKDENGWTCVFFAVAYMRLPTFQLLVDRGANLKHKDYRGRSLLHIAAIYHTSLHIISDLTDIVRLLIDMGADINATDSIGLTPINTVFSFIWYYNPKIINQLLYQPEIDVTIPDFKGITVLHRAVRKNHVVLLIDVLCKLDADINVRDKFGRTPLQFLNNRSLSIASILLQFGADTKVLHYLEKDLLKNKKFLRVLKRYQIMRKVADLSNDPNVDAILAKHRFVFSKEDDINAITSIFLFQIEWMKNTIFCGELTCYEFLHAKKRVCMKVAAEIPEMYNILVECDEKYGYNKYLNMVIKNYLWAIRPLPPMESRAISFSEENLDLLFNNKLPSLVLYKIKKYIDIEDMITLENMKLFGSDNNESMEKLNLL